MQGKRWREANKTQRSFYSAVVYQHQLWVRQATIGTGFLSQQRRWTLHWWQLVQTIKLLTRTTLPPTSGTYSHRDLSFTISSFSGVHPLCNVAPLLCGEIRALRWAECSPSPSRILQWTQYSLYFLALTMQYRRRARNTILQFSCLTRSTVLFPLQNLCSISSERHTKTINRTAEYTEIHCMEENKRCIFGSSASYKFRPLFIFSCLEGIPKINSFL